ncbi:MAG: glycoside hydrolase family 38 C-terminal domain-containing protein, partial [Clostridia bacterium]|nr:glycoside hydrolase family 38 C-terminal domain-containing protein [Clostridia bacterium]
ERGIPMMCFYGVGNHGGGPTKRTLQQIQKRMASDESLLFSSPEAYFKDAESCGKDLPVYRGDLQHHASGCYSTASALKRNNRKAENLLSNAEKLMTIAHAKLGLEYCGEKIQDAWKDVLFNQFHDVMGGCCIKDSIEDALLFYGEARSIGERVLNAAAQKLSWYVDTMKGLNLYRSKEHDWMLWGDRENGTPVVVFNPLSWEADMPVQISKLVSGVEDDEECPLPLQKIRGQQTNVDDKWNTLFIAKVPAFGYRLYWIFYESRREAKGFAPLKTTGPNVAENEYTHLEIDPGTGCIKSLFDKKRNTEIIRQGAVPEVIDISNCDTWAHGVFRFKEKIAEFGNARVEMIENGPVRTVIRAVSSYNRSELRQDYILYEGRPGVEVRVRLDWREQYKMLKLSFPVSVESPQATYEIPYGFLERTTDGEEQPGQSWVDLSGENG